MTPAQSKAKELVGKYKSATKDEILASCDYYHKQCALIAVDEIIDQLGEMIKPDNCIFAGENGEFLYGYDVAEFWQSVKEEIQKL